MSTTNKRGVAMTGGRRAGDSVRDWRAMESRLSSELAASIERDLAAREVRCVKCRQRMPEGVFGLFCSACLRSR
jgi:hypothetical protein